MSISRKLFLFIVLITLSVAGIPVSANEVYDASVSQMLAEQSQRIQQLETQLASLNQGQYLHSGGMDDCDDCCAGNPGFIGGAEMTFLKAHNNALSLSANFGGSAPIIPENDFQIAPRFWLGYEFAGGMGIRATYWGFDQSATSPTLPLATRLEANTVDLELTQTAALCKWDLLFSGGARYGRIDNQLTIDPGFQLPLELSHEFEGVGGTLAIGARRAIGNRGFALVGTARGSLLFGSTDATAILPFGNPPPQLTLTNNQQVLEIFELRLGGEWSRDLANGARVYTQALYEAQAWNVGPMFLGIGDSQIGFSGIAFNIGLAR